MKSRLLIATGFVAVAGLALPVLADASDHGNRQMQNENMPMARMQDQDAPSMWRQGMMMGGYANAGMMNGMNVGPHPGMMPMMMRMHGGMMNGMHKGFMGAGMWTSALDDNDDRMVSGEEFETGMQARAKAHDADGNGTMSIEEFEALHSGLVRGAMVDRFQHLDANGDGEVTQGEISASAQEMRGTGFGMMNAPFGRMPMSN